MSIQEAAQLVIQAMSVSKTGDILLLDMGQPIKILDLAKKMIKIAGKTPKLLADDDKFTTPNQIGIAVTGLKKGEKLHETINYEGELQPSEHKKILIAKEEKSKKYIPEAKLRNLINARRKGHQKIECNLKVISKNFINLILTSCGHLSPDQI